MFTRPLTLRNLVCLLIFLAFSLGLTVSAEAQDLIWAARAGGGGHDEGYDVAVLDDGSALVTGEFDGTAIFGPGEPGETTLTSTLYVDIFVARYNPDGTLAWARRAGGSGPDGGGGIAVLDDGSSLVTGEFSDTTAFGPGEPEETTLTSAGGNDIFVTRFAHSPPTAVEGWEVYR